MQRQMQKLRLGQIKAVFELLRAVFEMAALGLDQESAGRD